MKDPKIIIENLGCKYNGSAILNGINLAYFTDPLTKSTLAIDVDKITSKRVARKN